MSVMSIFKKKSFYIILVLVLAVVGYFTYLKIMNDRYEAEHQEDTTKPSGEMMEDIDRKNTYNAYLENYKDASRPSTEAVIDLFSYSAADKVIEHEHYEGKSNVLVSEEGGFVEWTVNVDVAGLYNIYLEYFPIKSKGIDIERTLLINGELPFQGADALVFSRVWTNDGEVEMDNRGNEIRPSQIEAPRWENTYLRDSVGYIVEPYSFYLDQGENVIRLQAVSEPFAIGKIAIGQEKEMKSYSDFISEIDLSAYQNTDPKFIYKKQGEDAKYKSSPTLYAIYDRASSNTEPYSASKIKLNSIGGDAWRVSGQWIEWDIEVPEDGIYNIAFKAKQNYSRGKVSTRNLMIDGVTPFTEAAELEFKYSTGWELTYLTDSEGNPCKVPLTKGKHVIRLEVTLGQLGDILTQIEESIYRLNAVYRKILIVTGSTPDPYRDYNIDKIYPTVITAMEEEITHLNRIVDQLAEYTGQKGAESAVASNLAEQLKRFVKNPDTIPRTMVNFKQNISSMGTNIINLSTSQMDIDFIYVCADGAKLPKVSENFFGKVSHEVRSFASSFFVDYSTIGDYHDEGETIEVWLLSGRDQSTILKNMIDETFTPNTGIGVNVKLVGADALLPAVVAGTGPDVALTVGSNIPVDYALRDAAVDLTQFDGFKELAKQYHESAFVPFEFEGGIYGIPETQNFNVLFYRTDILGGDLGFNLPEDLPQSWDDVIEMLPILQKSNMEFGLPSSDREINGVKNPDTSAMTAILYQNGARLYSEDAKRTMLDAEAAVEAFDLYTSLYVNYGLPQKFDFVNRFRSGEMPIGVADYVSFNTLSVFAPEIRGLWDFALVPGTVQPDGTIDRSVATWGEACLMLKNADDYDASWEFLKWWSEADTKTRYARELESIMGASARYATANRTAFEEMAWSTEHAAIIEEQWKWVVGTPNVAGGYSTIRHMINAFRKVTYEKEDPRETLLDYTRIINDDIWNKRNELGLDND